MLRRSEKEFLEAIAECHGLVSVIAAKLGVTPKTVRNRMKKSEKIAAAVTEAREATLDKAESKLFEAIKAREPWAITLYLKTQGKSRVH